MSADFEDSDIFEEFLFESRDMLSEVETILMQLERERIEGLPLDRPKVDRVFRAFHSIKGTAGFLGLENLVAVTHMAENMLDLLRSGRLTLCENKVTALCDALDYCTATLDEIEATKSDASTTARAKEVRQVLHAMLDASPKPAPVAVVPAAPAPAPSAPAAPAFAPPVHEPVAHGFDSDGSEGEDSAAAFGSAGDELHRQLDVPATVSPHASSLHPAALSPGPLHDGKPGAAAAQAAVAAPSAKPRPKGGDEHEDGDGEAKQSIRVEVEKLDSLMNIVGELILAKNMVTHHQAVQRLDAEAESFQKAALQLTRVTRLLQDVAMSVRMVPIRGVFRRMLRVVRDLSRKLGKEVELDLVGEHTEVDRNLIEAIADPLVHIVRNSLDHGIEQPDAREACGKSRVGRIRLEARHHSGEVHIVIADDGRGLNRSKLLEKAIRQGLVEGDGEDMSEAEVQRLIFHPGFSTAEAVTDISGRGVGMDVVRRNIEALSGRVDVQSTLGTGTTLTLRIPLTLAIIDGMLVSVGGSLYTVPLLAVRESARIDAGAVTVLPSGAEVIRIRDELLPLVRLGSVTGTMEAHQSSDDGLVIVLESRGHARALLVDEVVGQRQTVVKALPPYLGHLRGVSGCSILDNGEITLILDPGAITGDTRMAA